MRQRQIPIPVGDTLGDRRLLATLVLLVVVASIGTFATWATFTSSTAQSQTISSGTVTIALGATGAATNRLDIGASGIVAGDTIQRSVDLTNSGSADLSAITLTTTANPSSKLDTDTTKGLQMTIDGCTQPWTEAGTPPAYTYTCGGSPSTVLASSPVIGTNVSLGNLTALTAGNTDHLRVTLSLPSTADSTFENQSSTITYTFTGTQRAGTNR